MIVWFEDVTVADAELVGGKGANLGECVNAGLVVPPGFCVSTDAYREATFGVADLLAAAALRGDAAAARKRVLELPIPEPVRDAIVAAYVRLGTPPVAVRSSATAEDLDDASFAGQQDTYLGVVGIEAVLDAVRSCWASLWTDRAVAYRRRQGVSGDGLALAVVVQAMVTADTAGVLFTSDPVSGDAGTMLASASYGLGESVVSALVIPDTLTIARHPLQVVRREIGSKRTRIDIAPGGGTVTSDVSGESCIRQSVTDAQLRRLAELGERVERHYGTGQDIEWAFAGDELYLLQARPITTGSCTTAGHTPPRGRLERLLRDDLIEHFPEPFPLDLMAIHRLTEAAYEVFGLISQPASSMIVGNADGIIRTTIAPLHLRPSGLAKLFRPLLTTMRNDSTRFSTEERLLRADLTVLTRRAEEVGSASDEESLHLVQDAVEKACAVTRLRFVRYLEPMIIRRLIAVMLIRLSRGNRGITPEDLYDGTAYRTAEITAAIDGFAAMARESEVADVLTVAAEGEVDAALTACPGGQRLKAGIEAFLARHGARTARPYLPFSSRSWRENPELLYTLLAATLRGAPSGRRASVDAARQVESALPGFLRRAWRSNTERLRADHFGREESIYLIEELFCVARAGMDEIARRLVARRQIDSPDDMPLLYFNEVEEALCDDGLCLQPVVARRQRRRSTARAIWWDRGEKAHGDRVLHGLSASAGRAFGEARIIRSADEFHRLRAGDVLVCPYTDPTWTPLFSLAVAVVADSGGPLSHAAIVAREIGIPAVLGVGNATGLPDGANLLVDGTEGTVTILAKDQTCVPT